MDARQPGAGPGIEESTNIEDLRHLRLMAPPDELVREDPAIRSTADLHIDHRTLTARTEGGRLTKRNVLDRVRRVLSLGMWRQRAGCGVPIGFVNFIEEK